MDEEWLCAGDRRIEKRGSWTGVDGWIEHIAC
jgi:hypothetical protein